MPKAFHGNVSQLLSIKGMILSMVKINLLNIFMSLKMMGADVNTFATTTLLVSTKLMIPKFDLETGSVHSFSALLTLPLSGQYIAPSQIEGCKRIIYQSKTKVKEAEADGGPEFNSAPKRELPQASSPIIQLIDHCNAMPRTPMEKNVMVHQKMIYTSYLLRPLAALKILFPNHKSSHRVH